MVSGGDKVVGIVLDPAVLAVALAEAISDPAAAVTVEGLDEAFAAYWEEFVGQALDGWSFDGTGTGTAGEVVPMRVMGEKTSSRARPAA
jgi:hypothetical protein